MTEGQELIHELGIPGYGADEVGFMEEAILDVRPDFIGDWGTNRGSSARIFYELTRLHQIDCEIHTVELPLAIARLDRDHPGQAVGLHLQSIPIHRHEGDGATVTLEMAILAGSSRPLFFLDGDHLKENVFREIVSIHRALPEANLLLHDTSIGPGVAVWDYRNRFPYDFQVIKLESQAGMMRLVP